MAGFFRKVEETLQLQKTDGGKLRKEEVVRFEETGGKHRKEQVVHYKEDLLDGNYAGQLGYPNQLKGEQYESGLVKKLKQKVYNKKGKIGRRGAGDDSSSDSD